MGIIEGTKRIKVWKGSYDFAIDGGAVGSLTLRSNDGDIPNGSVIRGAWLDVTTALTSSGSPTVALTSGETAADLLAATAFGSAPWSSTGRKSLLPAFTGATSLKNTAARNPAAVIAVAALTGGRFDVYVEYE